MRDGIKDFADAMEKKMQEHDPEKKDSWKTCDMEYLWKELDSHLGDLLVSRFESKENIKDNSVDVGNFLAMIWNRVKE